MGIAIVRFRKPDDGLISYGRLEGGVVKPIPGPAESLGNFIREKTWKQNPANFQYPLGGLELLAPITAPCQIVCQGKNYLDHVLETGVKPEDKEYNILFTKADSSLAPPVGQVTRPEGVKLLDYEVELGLVIGAEITGPVHVDAGNLHEYVAGVVMANDLSARDVQVPQRQWFKGKSFRGFCPVGPILHLLDAEEVPLLNDMELSLSVNGESRQRANTSQMMHKPAETLMEVSRIFDLRPGDILLTGTPGGVAMKVKPKSWFEEVMGATQGDKERFARFVEDQATSSRYLKSGDQIESTIRSSNGVIDLGRQRLTIQN
jgi:2-keto-4-pentenoate hydratase/2-oxohepta-3-ene-1,7-dioic acid hydratase in catechol pathway